MSHARRFSRGVASFAGMLSLAVFGFVSPAHARETGCEAGVSTRQVTFSVVSPDENAHQVAGFLYWRGQLQGKVLQIALHGGSYNHQYWDAAELNGHEYSYARYMACRGFAVLALDNLGAGASSRPDGDLVTLPVEARALHQIIQGLRAAPAGAAFRKIVLVGHSMGSAQAVFEQGTFHDADGLVVTGWSNTPHPVRFPADLLAVLFGAPYATRRLGCGPCSSTPATSIPRCPTTTTSTCTTRFPADCSPTRWARCSGSPPRHRRDPGTGVAGVRRVRRVRADVPRHRRARHLPERVERDDASGPWDGHDLNLHLGNTEEWARIEVLDPGERGRRGRGQRRLKTRRGWVWVRQSRRRSPGELGRRGSAPSAGLRECSQRPRLDGGPPAGATAGLRVARSRRPLRPSRQQEIAMIYAEPGQPGSKMTFKKRYENFIGGKWVAPVSGRYFENVTPVTGKPFCEVARSHRGGHRARARRRARGRRPPGAGPRRRERADDPQQDRRPHGGEPRDCSRSPRPGTTASRSARRWPPTCRWRSTTSATSPACIRAQEGTRRRDRRGHRRLPLPRAARRRRPDHPVELPAPDGGLEARPGAGRRQLRGAQARRADAGVDPGADGADRRPAAAGRAQRRQRLRRRGRQAAGVAARASPRSPSPARPPPAG